MEDAQALSVIRSYLLGIVALVLLGLLLELFMLNHVKTPLQLLPIGLASVAFWCDGVELDFTKCDQRADSQGNSIGV
jgi:hypothetical protein